jgi:acyl-CoA synthetase (AMP-forming)/AMP-acid ligase II
MFDFEHILKNGVEISSSGTTGTPKVIFRTPKNLIESAKVAINAQKLTKNSKVLTVTRMTHAGGLLTQSLPAYILGAKLTVKQFNPYGFLKEFQNYTHTFITPTQMKMLMNTKTFNSYDLTGKWILGGSDPVTWEMIEAFVNLGATVQPNWGMSEIGPITINTVFDSIEKVHEYREKCTSGTILGDVFWCQHKVVNGVLWVKGPTCYIDDWMCTGDRVIEKDSIYWYQGRDVSNLSALSH